jgi:hypothetical protein
MRRKNRNAPAHAAPKAPRPPRVVPALLGILVVVLAASAATAFLMPELLVDLVPPPLDVRTAGLAAAGAAAVTTLLLVLTVVRGRRSTAEQEFSRPQLTTVAALSPEEEAEARRVDETAPLLPEPPSLAPPVEAPVAAAEIPAPEPSPVSVGTAPARPRGSGVHIFEANRPAPGNGSPEPAPAPAAQPSVPTQDGSGWHPRHTEDGGLLVAEAWSFGPGKGRRRR